MKKAAVGSALAIVLIAAGYAVGRRGPGADTRSVRAQAFVVHRDGETRTIQLSENLRAPASVEEGVELFRSTQGDDKLWSRAWLVKFLEENPEQALELLARFETETDVETLEALAEAFSDPRIAGDPRIVAAMLRLAETGDLPARRLAALTVLMNMPEPDAATVLRIAKNDASNDVRIGALAVTVDWLQNHPTRRADLARGILDVANASSDVEVRGHAIQAIAIQDAAMPEDVLVGMQRFLSDSSDQNRSLAAMALGNTRSSWAVTTLETAYLSERSPEVRHEFLIHIVRAGGADAIPALRRLADPDAVEYADILASGVTDPVQVFEKKQQMDLEAGRVSPHHEHHD